MPLNGHVMSTNPTTGELLRRHRQGVILNLNFKNSSMSYLEKFSDHVDTFVGVCHHLASGSMLPDTEVIWSEIG